MGVGGPRVRPRETCHAITHVNSTRGNADYTIEEPLHYPFAFSENGALRWVNRQLVKSKPDLHRRTFLDVLDVLYDDKSVEYISGGSNVPEIKEFFWKWRRSHYPRTESSLNRYSAQVLLRQGDPINAIASVRSGISTRSFQF